MASIRKTKKALKREIRRIDEAVMALYDHCHSNLRHIDVLGLLFWYDYFHRKLKALGRDWTGECIKPIICKLPPKINQLIKSIKNGKSI